MTSLLGANLASEWAWVVRRPPADTILTYVLVKWKEYEATYAGVGQPFAQRDEPSLTEGLAAFLNMEEGCRKQPFDGEFFGELKRYDLGPDGKRIIVGRTDIEWRLSGTANFIIEFKVIGGGRPAIAYLWDGIARFVDGRYGPTASEGAMWAFIRPGSRERQPHIEAMIDLHAAKLFCQAELGQFRSSPSLLAPSTASFDSLHQRSTAAQFIRLAHIFVDLP